MQPPPDSLSGAGVSGGIANLRSKAGRATVRDIARMAQVSHGTVSKALNGSAGVGPETTRRIVEIAERIGYRPNNIARSLRVRRTNTLGVVTNEGDGLFTTAMLRGVTDLATDRGFGVFICNSDDQMTKERMHLELLLDKQVDGIILTGSRVIQRGAPAVPVGRTPLVYLYEYTKAVDAPCVLPDDEASAFLATSYLRQMGRRRIALINGPTSYEVTSDRLVGYRRALQEGSASSERSLERTAPAWHQDAGYHMAQDLMQNPNPPDAIMCASDELAAGAITGLRDLQQRVPDDVAVIGIDGREFAAHLPIPLTTVALPFAEMGRVAAQLLFDAIDGKPLHPRFIRVAPQLVTRSSA